MESTSEKQRGPELSAWLPSVSYTIAYHLLPPLAHRDFKTFQEFWNRKQIEPAYVTACQIRHVHPVASDLEAFQFHRGNLDDDREYYILEYPAAPPFAADGINGMVLAPFFSAVVRQLSTGQTSYYVLGHAPDMGKELSLLFPASTFRCVTESGANCNLGPGPQPTFDAFLEHVRLSVSRAPALSPKAAPNSVTPPSPLPPPPLFLSKPASNGEFLTFILHFSLNCILSLGVIILMSWWKHDSFITPPDTRGNGLVEYVAKLACATLILAFFMILTNPKQRALLFSLMKRLM